MNDYAATNQLPYVTQYYQSRPTHLPVIIKQCWQKGGWLGML